MFYICVVKSNKAFYLLTDREGYILSGDKERLLNHWTKGWEGGLQGSIGFSTGACLSFIYFSPSVFTVQDEDELRRLIGRDEPYELLRIGGMGGWFDGIECTGSDVNALWENGEKPVFFTDELIEQCAAKEHNIYSAI